MEEEKYGIDIDNAHQKAIELIPEDFFWDCIDELAPFGSDEGDTALAEFRDWRKENPTIPTLECLKWVIESVGEIDFADYNSEILSRAKIKSQLEDEDFDDQQYIYTLDISVIATGFAQLVDEGIIEVENKEVIQLAIDRQLVWAELSEDWDYAKEYISNLKILDRVLKAA
ncbi:MAG TPA: hypothetical protein PK328_06195 [Chitinophagaceae bacterium]|nr:hypothetical protein [Chitinophagaceae bacterium]